MPLSQYHGRIHKQHYYSSKGLPPTMDAWLETEAKQKMIWFTDERLAHKCQVRTCTSLIKLWMNRVGLFVRDTNIGRGVRVVSGSRIFDMRIPYVVYVFSLTVRKVFLQLPP